MVATTVDLEAVRRQLEFYFSDSNLPRDKFLRAKTEENEQGYVNIETLLSFKRLQDLGASAANIAAAAASSTVIAVDESKKRIRRINPLPAVSLFNSRAVFAKGWTAGSEAPSIDDLTELFSPSGRVLSVRVRRWIGEDGKKHFKGSVFVEMENPEAAQRVVAEEYQIDIVDADGKPIRKELLLLPVEEYFEQKKAENRNRQKRVKNRGQKRDAPDNNEPDSKKDTTGDAKQEQQNYDAKPSASADVKEPNTKKRREEKPDREMKPGLILKFDGFGPEVSREDIREAFEPQGEIAWVDFQRGNSEGYIRFAREGAAKEACTAMTESKTEFGGKVPVFEVLSGEAEETYWKQMWEKKDQMVEAAKRRRRENNRGGGRGGRRFRGGGRGRGRR